MARARKKARTRLENPIRPIDIPLPPEASDPKITSPKPATGVSNRNAPHISFLAAAMAVTTARPAKYKMKPQIGSIAFSPVCRLMRATTARPILTPAETYTRTASTRKKRHHCGGVRGLTQGLPGHRLSRARRRQTRGQGQDAGRRRGAASAGSAGRCRHLLIDSPTGKKSVRERTGGLGTGRRHRLDSRGWRFQVGNSADA